VTWVDHGYRFVVTVYVQGPILNSADTKKQVPLTDAELTAVADGIRLPPARRR